MELKGPIVKPYEGIGDPDAHVSNFQWAIKMIPMNPKLWSLYFAGALDGLEQYWLTNLSTKSIGSFEELCTKFCSNEDSNIKHTPYSLVGSGKKNQIKQ